MRQLTCTAPGQVAWVEVDEPTISAPDDVLVRPIAVARCEIDPLLISLGPLEGSPGFALGHEAVTEVVAVGDAVIDLVPGDVVLPSFQVSCGTCGPCHAGHTAVCASYPVLSDYGMQPLSGVEYGGMLSDLVRVPHAATMLGRMPAGIDPVSLASVPDNVADGYRAVAPYLREQPGMPVLVVIHGTPSIGLYAAQAALALDASSVTVASDDPEAIELATALGATAVPTDFGKTFGRFPLVVDCGQQEAALHFAIRSTEPEGTCHSVSYLAGAKDPLPLGRMYTLGIRFQMGRAHSAALLPEVLALIEADRLHPAEVTTRVVSWEAAPEAYVEPALKLVVTR